MSVAADVQIADLVERVAQLESVISDLEQKVEALSQAREKVNGKPR